MARARAIETRLEKLVPALDEYFSTGFLSRDEIQELSRMRTRFEYKLVAKPLLLLDVRNAITFELELEEKLRTYCLRTKVSLKHRWSIISRIETIYQIGLKHVRLRREKDALQDDYVRFLRYYNRHGSLSKLYAQLMILYPTRSSTWVEAAEWEGISLNKMDNARIIIQQALRTMSEDAEVWACAVKLELHFASRLLSGLVEEHREEQRKRRAAKPEEEVADETDLAARLRAENAALGKILVDLELAKSVVAESVEAPTSTPHVLQRQLQAAGEFPFAADVVRAIVEAGIDRWSSTVVGDGAAEKQKQREVWAADGAQMMHNFIMADHLMASGCAQSPMTDVEAFLRHGCSSTEPPPPLVDGAQRYAATLRAMISLIELYASATRGNKNDPAAMLVQRIRVGPQCDVHLSTVMSSLLSFFAEKQASGVSAMCRAMLENPADVSGAKVAQWLMSGTGKALTRAQKEEMVEPAVRRVAELVERIGGDLLGTPATSKRRADESTSSNPFAAISDVLMRYVLVDEMDSTKRGKTATASSLSAMELHTLMAWWRAEEAKKSKTSVRVAAALRLLQRCGLAPSTPAKAGETEMLAVLRQALFHIATGHHDGGSSKLPLTLWRMCSALEALPCSEVDGAPSSSSSRNKKKKADVPSGSDSDDEDEEDVGAAKNTQPHAFADIGLLWLAAADAATLDASSEADRIDGVCTLLRSRLASLTGLRRPTRGDVVELLRQSQATAPWVAAMQRSMSYARRCAPFPRYAFTSVVLPVVEGLADYHANARTSAAREVKTAMADARSCHEALLALYRQSPHLNQFQAVLFHGGDDEKMSGMTASTQRAVEANTADWLAYICFEREVAKDLHRAKEAVARATKDALHAQSVVARLQRM